MGAYEDLQMVAQVYKTTENQELKRILRRALGLVARNMRACHIIMGDLVITKTSDGKVIVRERAS